jgi:hypothetical protein
LTLPKLKTGDLRKAAMAGFFGHEMSEAGHERHLQQQPPAHQLPLCPVCDRGHAATQYVAKCQKETSGRTTRL